MSFMHHEYVFDIAFSLAPSRGSARVSYSLVLRRWGLAPLTFSALSAGPCITPDGSRAPGVQKCSGSLVRINLVVRVFVILLFLNSTAELTSDATRPNTLEADNKHRKGGQQSS